MRKITYITAAVIVTACMCQACNSPDSKEVRKDGTVVRVKPGMDPKRDTGFNAPANDAPKDARPTKNLRDYPNESHVDTDDAEFMKLAALGGMMEVDLGKAAQQSANAKIKAFAAIMVRDHSSANKRLQQLAAEAEILLPTAYFADQRDHIEAMKALQGQAFDRSYVNMMVQDHEKTLQLFKKGAETRHKEVKKFASEMLPVLEGHYKQALVLKAALK